MYFPLFSIFEYPYDVKISIIVFIVFCRVLSDNVELNCILPCFLYRNILTMSFLSLFLMNFVDFYRYQCKIEFSYFLKDDLLCNVKISISPYNEFEKFYRYPCPNFPTFFIKLHLQQRAPFAFFARNYSVFLKVFKKNPLKRFVT